MNPFKFLLSYFKRIQIPTSEELATYYPYYLLAHKNPVNKLLHVAGNILTVAYVTVLLLLAVKISLLFLLALSLTPFIVYIGAWPGHFIFEKNVPATFKVNPALTKTCDWIMISQLLTGKLNLDTRTSEFTCAGLATEEHLNDSEHNVNVKVV